MTPTQQAELEQKARAFCEQYADEFVMQEARVSLVALLAATRRATLERVMEAAKQRAYSVGLNEPMRTNHLYAFACDIEQQAKEIPS